MLPVQIFHVNSSTAVPPAASDPPLLEVPRTTPHIPAFFVDISTEDIRIVQQSSGIISTLELPGTEDTNRTLRDV